MTTTKQICDDCALVAYDHHVDAVTVALARAILLLNNQQGIAIN